MNNIRIEMKPDNRAPIEEILRKVAGTAVLSTIRTYSEAELALDRVRSDFSLRFPVPENLDFAVRYINAGGNRVTTELVFSRNQSLWLLESASRAGPFLSEGIWIKYRVDAWAHAIFTLYARDGRSMRSVECTSEELTAHQRIALAGLEASVLRRRGR